MADTKFEAKTSTVEDLFSSKSAAFHIPQFQRRYAWGVSEVSQLIADIYTDKELLESSDSSSPYFLGSLVFAETGTASGPKLVLDGQQRLTSISLMLGVLQQKLPPESSEAADIKNLLETGKIGGRRTTKLTLQEDDAKVYRVIMADPNLHENKEYKKHPIAVVVAKIMLLLDQYISDLITKGMPELAVLHRLVSRLVYEVEFVCITAPSEAEAFLLFESLNDRGLALNAADLVKNKLLARCGNENLEEAIEYWKEIVEQVEPSEIVDFLRYYWIANEGEVRNKDLYAKYNDKLSKLHSSEALVFVQKLKNTAQHYKYITEPNSQNSSWSDEVREILKRLLAYRARSCRPAILKGAELEHNEFLLLLRAIESVTIRYSVVGSKNPNKLEGAYNHLCSNLRSKEIELPEMISLAFEGIMPNNEEFKDSFSTINVVVSPTWRAILVRLNEQLGTGETTILGSNKVEVEHILPVKPNELALREAELDIDSAESLIGRIGNLTLIFGKINKQLSNGPFSKKKAAFANSEIALNQWISQRSRWTKSEILERSQLLSEIAVKAWPWPVQ
ncbi:MAG: DUF262 domain-containing protein [Anaerolineae bacterium]|nr:DUF262 domain-containing protein [Gloeobacterales cyanobacterium ES-bin-313]